MSRTGISRYTPRNITLIGNYLPRRCGIATFTSDLLESLSGVSSHLKCSAVAMNDTLEGYAYPGQVRFDLYYRNTDDYRLAAEFLNMNRVEMVSLQHEYGLFGGKAGAYILDLLHNLNMPVVTTLHTVLREPDSYQKTVLQQIARVSERLVVMSLKGRELLQQVYRVPEEKIALIPHGIPDVGFVDSSYYKDHFGVEGKKVILTFGLLSPGKGLEYMIDALPQIVAKHPDTVYIILGATHPHVQKEYGESYRDSLQQRSRNLGVEKHIIFHNRFVSLEELCEFLGAADIYVTPYLNPEQVVSGTLAYALGAGKAVVSTPYWHAQEMLDEGRGRLVPFRDSRALASEINDLLDNETERHAMRKRAYLYCRSMIWPEVARRYAEVFAEVKKQRLVKPRVMFPIKTLQDIPFELPKPKFDHFMVLTDNVGILQHSKFAVPDRNHGYCTDDNARALIVTLMAQDLFPAKEDFYALACRYLSFLLHAFNEENGRFRNFMSFDLKWQEESGSDDSHARAVWGLGMAVGLSKWDNLTAMAANLFNRAFGAMMDFQFPRSICFGLVGIHAYLRKFKGDSEVRRVRETLANRLFDLYLKNSRDDWPWLEDTLTYCNGKIPHALLLCGQWLQRDDMVNSALNSLDWLVKIQLDAKGNYVPIGNRGWYTYQKERAIFDQQPIEAYSMIEALIEAYNYTRDKKWFQEAMRCLKWFLGGNNLNIPIYDYQTGGCRDGLNADGANQNQGAESTLAWLLSLLNMYALLGSQTDA